MNELARKWDFAGKRYEQIHDRLVVGVVDKALSKDMQKLDIDSWTSKNSSDGKTIGASGEEFNGVKF